LDNRLTEGNEALATDLVKDSLEYPERVLSSKILLTEMGGPMGLARALSSNPNVSSFHFVKRGYGEVGRGSLLPGSPGHTHPALFLGTEWSESKESG